MKPGLRLDQGPPFAIPLAFLVAAPIFLGFAGLIAAFVELGWSVTRWHPSTIMLTHLVTLGYLGMAMLGALTQMIPVAAGGVLPRVVGVGRAGFVLLLLGVPLLAWGMYGNTAALLAGAGASALALLGVATAALLALTRAPSGATRAAMRLALAALVIVVGLGLALVAWLSGIWWDAPMPALANAHAGLALSAWVALLVTGAAYQVVPMLQVTPNYPAWLTRHFAPLLACLTVSWSILAFLGPADVSAVLAAAIAVAFALFAIATLVLQVRRRRKRGDATLHYWRLGLLGLLGASLLTGFQALAPGFADERVQMLAGMLFLLAFAASVVNGMILKIIPFLAWFHLHAQVGMRQAGLTNMHDFYPEPAAWRQFLVHASALGFLLPSPWLPVLARPGGLLLAASSFYMAWRLTLAARLFHDRGGHFGAS
jgi:hypothetical protein